VRVREYKIESHDGRGGRGVKELPKKVGTRIHKPQKKGK